MCRAAAPPPSLACTSRLYSFSRRGISWISSVASMPRAASCGTTRAEAALLTMAVRMPASLAAVQMVADDGAVVGHGDGGAGLVAGSSAGRRPAAADAPACRSGGGNAGPDAAAASATPCGRASWPTSRMAHLPPAAVRPGHSALAVAFRKAPPKWMSGSRKAPSAHSFQAFTQIKRFAEERITLGMVHQLLQPGLVQLRRGAVQHQALAFAARVVVPPRYDGLDERIVRLRHRQRDFRDLHRSGTRRRRIRRRAGRARR